MPAPTLTQNEIDQITIELARQTNLVASLTQAVPNNTARVAELAIVDGGYKKFFDYYNTNIIGKYDAERKALDGQFINSPIAEADIIGPATLNTTIRTTPTAPSTTMIRVSQFDGTPLVYTASNETQGITDQIAMEVALVSGFGSGAGLSGTTRTASIFNSASTSINITDSAFNFNPSINDVFVIYSGGDAGIIRINSIVDGGEIISPYTQVWGVTVLVNPSGTIASNASLTTFGGFNNTERTSKVASNSNLQPIMMSLIASLETAINLRISQLAVQTIALNTNEDPDAASQISSTLVNVSTSSSNLTDYLVTTLISDSGLTTLSTERGVRSPQISGRVSQIVNNYTNQTENYYDKRYSYANNRGNTASGSLRLQKVAEQAEAAITSYKSTAEDSVTSLTNILNV